jgi:hypothetical protein
LHARSNLIVAPSLESLGLSPDRPLVIVDVDEVLGLFIKGFGEFLARQGYEFRVDRYGLFQNIYRPGAAEPVPEAEGKALYQAYFRDDCGELEPAPGAVEALDKLGRTAEILILSNAPAEAEKLRRGWLQRHGLAHPLILGRGPKGPVVAGLTRQSHGRSAFIDDILQHLDSVAEHAPETATFQHVADERLQPLAPTSPRHRRIDDWRELGLAVAEAVRG